jgi:hypothetical protein
MRQHASYDPCHYELVLQHLFPGLLADPHALPMQYVQTGKGNRLNYAARPVLVLLTSVPEEIFPHNVTLVAHPSENASLLE